MDRDNRSAIGGDKGSSDKFEYGQPKGRIFDHATANFKNVVVIGDDGSGEPRILSSLPQAETAAWLERVTELSPTT